jgi:uncharacterized membrane protein YsdA (DUF1294 family)/cold shock CspA family protein
VGSIPITRSTLATNQTQHMQALIRGNLVSWKQDKGFGFIRPDDGGKDVFVHVRDFGNIARLPKVGDVVQYRRLNDGTGRFRAADVHLEGVSRAASKSPTQSRVNQHGKETLTALRELMIVMAFACVVIALTVFGSLPIIIPPYYLVTSLLAFMLYAFDKSAAMNKRWRTRESTLLLVGLAGGWPGALVAQGMFRHKSRKSAFLVPFWLSVILNCGLLYLAATKSGAAAIHKFL